MADKRTQLLEAAIDLFAKEGFWNTPTARIAKHAGVATGTLFNYFESKDVLIDAVFLQLKRELAEAMMTDFPAGTDLKAASEHLWYQYANWGLANESRYQLMRQLILSKLVSEAAEKQHKAEFPLLYQELITIANTEAIFRDYPVELVMSTMEAQLDAAIQYALGQQSTGVRAAKLIMQSFEIFWNGVTG